MPKKRQPQGFVAYIRITCQDDTEQVKRDMCGGAKRQLQRARKKPTDPFWFCLHHCYKRFGRLLELVGPEDVQEAQQTGQLDLM